MIEENVTANPTKGEVQAAAAPQTAMEEHSASPAAQPNLGKFKSVDALVRAYGELEAEFTRRSQRLKALEEAEQKRASEAAAPQQAVMGDEALLRAVNENEEVRARVLSDYLSTLKGVPLLGTAGVGVTAPAARPKNIRDAGALALGYLKTQKTD